MAAGKAASEIATPKIRTSDVIKISLHSISKRKGQRRRQQQTQFLRSLSFFFLSFCGKGCASSDRLWEGFEPESFSDPNCGSNTLTYGSLRIILLPGENKLNLEEDAGLLTKIKENVILGSY